MPRLLTRSTHADTCAVFSRTPPRYTFKVQEVRRGRAGREERRTLAKARVDLSAYCDASTEPLPRELFLQLK